MKKVIKIPSYQIIYMNSLFVYFLRGKEVWRGRKKISRGGRIGRGAIVAGSEKRIKEIYYGKTGKALKGYGVKILV